jgi:hypothetical protein
MKITRDKYGQWHTLNGKGVYSKEACEVFDMLFRGM